MPKSVVSIVKGTDPQQMVAEALSLLGGAGKLIRPGSVVVLKPNAGREHLPGTGAITSPDFVAAVIKEVRKARPKEIIVAESAATGSDTLEAFKTTGIARAAEDAGADRLIDIKREKDLIDVKIRGGKADVTSMPLPRFLLEADHLVNLPILKAHAGLIITCALKNIKGVLQDKTHIAMHQTNLLESIVDLWTACRADLQIVDAIRPGEGYSPQMPLPVDFGCVLASRDPVAIDATCCRMIGMDFSKVRWLLEAAHTRGLGEYEEKSIEIRGRSIADVFKPLWFPFLGGFEQWPEYKIYSGGACSGCQCIVASFMELMKAKGEYDKHAGATIVLGRPQNIPRDVAKNDLILFGNCTRKYRNRGIWGYGCPPDISIGSYLIEGKEIARSEDFPPDARERRVRELEIFKEYATKKRDEFAREVRGEKGGS